MARKNQGWVSLDRISRKIISNVHQDEPFEMLEMSKVYETWECVWLAGGIVRLLWKWEKIEQVDGL